MDKSGIAPEDYKYISEILFKATGMDLGESKEYLLESRLKEVWESLKLKTFSEFIQYLKTHSDPKLIKIIGEKMTTNETLFFRDNLPFDFFRQQIIPVTHQRNAGKELKIWSAACSTGQEPYTIAICLQEESPKYRFEKVKILATDISPTVLERAKAGLYSKYEMARGMPPNMLEKYFLPVLTEFEIKPELKKDITFQECNLTSLSINETFDVIFLRNVLIYFDIQTKSKILDAVYKMLKPNGFIFLGAAETMMGVSEKFLRVENSNSSVYQRS
jgi:chemotaxis protein methyltransferase CheR